MDIGIQIERLLQYGLQQELIEIADKDYSRNRIMSVLKIEDGSFQEPPMEKLESPISILDNILNWAAEQKLLPMNSVTYRDQLDTAIMNCLMPRPSEVNRQFYGHYSESPERATNYFYQLSKHAHYIRTDRIAKNEHWFSSTEYGELEITINLSKPEKDPTTIEAEKMAAQHNYPLCLLCKENVGYDGKINHPARQSHRIIPVELCGEPWYFQFSPYVYYNEHAIVFSSDHRDMKISKEGFARLLDFVEKYPHYFVGSNADLPIVGGSILSHDHFQGGNHEFPMAKAPIENTYTIPGYDTLSVGIVKWPMSVIRLTGERKEQVVQMGNNLLESWKRYSDEEVDIYSHTEGVSHNTITPIARMNGGKYELDLVLRNNRTNEQHPLGIFHPHDEVHHIKKENIGLIEVMGLAVLPGRLQEELRVLGGYILREDWEQARKNPLTMKHVEWAMEITKQEVISEDTIHEILHKHVGLVFSRVLEHAGVFKRDEDGQNAFTRFIETFISDQ